LGKAELIRAMRGHTMRRAFRVDKTTLAALDAVLTIYLAGSEIESVPTLEILARPTVELARNARQILDALREEAPPDWEGAVVEDVSSVGGGSFSNASVPTSLLLWRGPKEELEACHARLRQGEPAVVTRMNQEGLAVDMRTVAESELALVVDAFLRVWHRQ
jgi:L-seryl-tRNA(Ser) seleniumtransferase